MNGETVTRLRAAAAKVDPYSQTSVLDWKSAPPAEQELTTLAPAEPRPSSEPVESARNSVVSGYTLYLPPGTDVTAQDRMRVRGEVFDVLGDPADWMGAGIVIQVGGTQG